MKILQAAPDQEQWPIKCDGELQQRFLSDPNSQMLDIGCGGGQFVAKMRAKNIAAFGIDTSDKIAQANNHNPAISAYLRAGDGHDLPFADHFFTHSVFMNSLHHLAQPLQGLIDAVRVTKPGGIIYIREPVTVGTMAQIMAPIDDETKVQQVAYDALQSCYAQKILTPVHCCWFWEWTPYSEYDAFEKDIVGVDETRLINAKAMRKKCQALFAQLAMRDDNGLYQLSMGSRVDVARVPDATIKS